MKRRKYIFLISLFFSFIFLASCNDGTFDHSVAPSDSGDAPELKFGTTYSFYLSDKSDQLWAKISGRSGALLPSVAAPKKAGWRFKGWKTKSGAEPLPAFGSADLSFYAQWEESSATKLIGSKEAPDAVGDVIFTDGSASSYPKNYGDLSGDQWKAAVAMLFTTTYNPATGSNQKGGQYQYKIAAGLLAQGSLQWCVDVLYEMTYEDAEIFDPSLFAHGYCCKDREKHFIYNMMYVGYDWNESLDGSDVVLGALSLSPYFGLQNYASSSQFKALATANVAPAFDYAINYGRSQKMDESYRDNWYLPSSGELTVLFADNEIFEKYNRLVIKKFMAAGSPSGILSRINPSDVFWTSANDTAYDTSLACVDARGHTTDTPTHDYVTGYWGSESPSSSQLKERIQVFDPCAGYVKKPMIYATSAYSDKFIYSRKDKAPNTDANPGQQGGYAYRYILYSNARLMSGSGAPSVDNKTAQHSVLAMRVFD